MRILLPLIATVSARTKRRLACSVDRFVSTYSNKLDSKGRVSIPASFRSVLMKDGFEGLYVYPSLDSEAVDCGGEALLGEIDALLTRFSPYSEERNLFSTALLGRSEVLKVDGEGRVVLTESIKTHACIGTEVTFVGQGHKFQVWEPNRFRAHLEEATLRLRALRKQLGLQDAAPMPRPPGARE